MHQGRHPLELIPDLPAPPLNLFVRAFIGGPPP